MLRKKKEKTEKTSFFQTVKKKEKKIHALPKDKGKLFTTLVWVSLSAIVFFSFLSFLFSVSANQGTRERTTKGEQQATTTKPLDSTEANYYAQNFVRDYIHVPKDTEGRDQRKERLMGFMVKPTQPNEENTQFNVGSNANERKLDEMTLKKSSAVPNGLELVYDIHYRNFTVTSKQVEKEVNKKKVKQTIQERKEVGNQAEFHVFVLKNKKGLAVQSFYLAPVKNLQAKIEAPSSNLEEAKHADIESLTSFTSEFLQKYAEGKKEDLAYMMKNPEALKGLYAFQEVKDLHFYEQGKETIISGKLLLQEKESAVQIQEGFSLHVTKKDGNHYVNQFEHKEVEE